MSRRRFLLDDWLCDELGRVCVRGPELHHLRDVLRLQVGEEVEVVETKRSISHLATIAFFSEEAAWLEIVKTLPSPQGPAIQLLIGLPKRGPAERIVEKCTELGVSAFHFFFAERSQGRLSDSEQEKRLERWSRIAQAALKQSGGNCLPIISLSNSLAQALERGQKEITNALQLILLCPIEAKLCSVQRLNICDLREKTLRSINSRENNSPFSTDRLDSTRMMPATCRILLGPEGGLSKEEILFAIERPFLPLSLGPKILRTETAAIVGSAIAAALFEMP